MLISKGDGRALSSVPCHSARCRAHRRQQSRRSFPPITGRNVLCEARCSSV